MRPYIDLLLLIPLLVCRGNGASAEVQESLHTTLRLGGVQSSGRIQPLETAARQLENGDGHASEGRGVVSDYAQNKPDQKQKPKPQVAQGAGHGQKLVPLHHLEKDANSTKQTTDGDKPAATGHSNEESEEAKTDAKAATEAKVAEHESSAHTQDVAVGYAPYICGESKEAVEEFCNSDRPICKYVTEQASGDKPFRITNRLRRNQGDCIRRCDARYGLSDAHCSRGETCIKVPKCTKCARLTSPGCEAF